MSCLIKITYTCKHCNSLNGRKLVMELEKEDYDEKMLDAKESKTFYTNSKIILEPEPLLVENGKYELIAYIERYNVCPHCNYY